MYFVCDMMGYIREENYFGMTDGIAVSSIMGAAVLFRVNMYGACIWF